MTLSSEDNHVSDSSKSDWKKRVQKHVERVHTLVDQDIWEVEHLGRKTARARLYSLMRILVLTLQGHRRNNLQVQSAALTFYSLIGIGPLIALGIMISSFVLQQSSTDPTAADQPPQNRAVEVITKAIAYAAPQLAIAADGEIDSSSLAPELTEMIDGFIAAAQSGTVGIIGTLMLFAIGIQVLTSIENSFNTLWGVDKGRKLGERIITYWTFISMGAVIGAASLTLVTIPIISQFMEQLPFGHEFMTVVIFLSPMIAFLLVTILLMIFFRFIPNTQVEWNAAFAGAILVTVSLHFYNKLSFLYVERVVDTRSLYGSVGIIVVLMLGLYVFWTLILLGGQVTYAVQNADYLTNENAWQKTSEQTQEIISLGVLIEVARRFKAGKDPIRFSELLKKLRVPSHVLNSSIHRLCELGYIRHVFTRSLEDEHNHAYQPGRPIESISLGSFKQAFQAYGNNDGAELITKCIPAINVYVNHIIALKDCYSATTTLDELIHNHSS